MTPPQLEIRFGQGGNDLTHLGPGWSGPEAGYRWAEGTASEFWLENPGDASDWGLELTLNPYIHPPALTVQRLEVLARGNRIGLAAFGDARTLVFRIPAAVLARPGPVRIQFRHPDATSPTAFGHPDDTRRLGFCFRALRLMRLPAAGPQRLLPAGEPVQPEDLARLTGLTAERFLLRFESLGDNCEFGLVQRRCGAEPLGLLRWAAITAAEVVRGLNEGFAGLGVPANMSVRLEGGAHPEYLIHDRAYAMTYHSFLGPAEVTEPELIERQATRLRFLRRKLLEDLAEGRKIFIIKRNDGLAEAELLAVLAALRRHNPAARLLGVLPAGAEHPPGTVRVTPEGLICGYIERFAPPGAAQDFVLETWLALCVNAARLADGG
ncbi:MAG: hypothetical protein ACP5NP_05590 [Acetobacteraceae bacterium]